MNREEFLKKFTVLGLASPFMANLLSSVSNEEFFGSEESFEGKVIIVGAGVAGISAGHILSQKKIDFEILEASSVHGGRVKKIDDFADFPIDLGAEWVHKFIKARPPILKSLFDGENPDYPIFRYFPETYSLWKDGELKEKNASKHWYIWNDWKFTQTTWYDFFDELVTPAIKERINYNSPVKEIDYSSEKVVLKTATGKEYTADKVLVTVPIKILQNRYIKFIPALPEKQTKEIDKEWMPNGLKVFIEFSEKFYPEVLVLDNLVERIVVGNYVYYDATLGKKTAKNILGLLADGHESEKYVSLKSDEAIIKFVMKELDEIFDGKASKYYVKHIVQNWTAEPFIQGTYSHRKASAKKLSAPLDDKVYFAGEAMHPKGRTIAVQGASESSYLALEKMFEAAAKKGR
ncbi:MAG: FAD-dependent oxidoreductase [Bacteroidia bacterium]|nr:FAD-dependent oxidoreductase [Bacteroidia bacterium]